MEISFLTLLVLALGLLAAITWPYALDIYKRLFKNRDQL